MMFWHSKFMKKNDDLGFKSHACKFWCVDLVQSIANWDELTLGAKLRDQNIHLVKEE
jgi:hypothetical protein